MIQLRIDITEMKTGRIALEVLCGKHKTKTETKGEVKIARHLKTVLQMLVAELADMIPGSSVAVGEEDVETLKAMENLGIKKEEDDA